MKRQNLQHFLTDAEGHRVPVSEQVYNDYWLYTNKEDYFMRILKAERFLYDPEKLVAKFLPSREDSFDRLIAAGEEYAANDLPVAEQAINAVFVRELMVHLTRQEQRVLYLLFDRRMNEREASKALGLSKTEFHRRKIALYSKCRRIMGNTS